MKKQLLSVILICIPLWLTAQSALYKTGNSRCRIHLPGIPSKTTLPLYSPGSSDLDHFTESLSRPAQHFLGSVVFSK